MCDACGAFPYIKLPSKTNIGYLNYLVFPSPEVTSLVELEISMYLSLAQVTVNKYEISYGEVHLLIMLTRKSRRDGGFSSWVIHRVDGNPGLSLRRNMGKEGMSGKRQRGMR